MSAESWKLEKDLCRCCHSEGSFHNLADPRFYLGEEEIYAEMLRQALNIDLSPMTGVLCSMTYTICDSCILRLRDAASFKRQVLLCEERFKDMYSNVLKALNPDLNPGFELKQELPTTEAIKVELSAIEDNDDDFDNHGDDDDDDDAEDNKPVFLLKQEDAKKKAKAKPAPKPKAKPKPKTKFKAKKAEPASEEQRKGVQSDRPKFVLKNEDYKKEGEEYLCTHCDKRYDKIFSLRFHVKTKHYKIPRFFCPYCKKEFMTPAPLTVHKLEEHNIDERFKCKACNAMFNTKIQLRKHKNNFHMLGEKYKCEFCEYESFSFEGMYKHKFKHKTVKDFHCRFCRKSFLRKATLDLHERIHTGDRRKVCKVCGQAFVQKASLNYHMTKYHPEVNF